MAVSSLTLTLLAGATVPRPVPELIASRIRSVKVTETDEERSAFTIELDAGRSGPLAALQSPLLADHTLDPGARVVLVLTLGAVPTVLMDGIVTTTEYSPGDGTGAATLQVTGEDLSYLMDLEEKDAEHPAQSDHLQVLAILAGYATHGITPMVIPPSSSEQPSPTDRVPTQQTTDLRHIAALAARNGHVAYVIPGPFPGQSTFYWGPPVREGLPQPALSVALGAQTTVLSAPSFRVDAAGPQQVTGTVQDPSNGQAVPVQSRPALRTPLAVTPVSSVTQARTRVLRSSGPGATTATARAQAQSEASQDAVVGEGTADGARYGAVLRPRGRVGLRGAGLPYDGLWYVRSVVHELAPGSYTQKFVIAREGYGSTVPVVPL